MKSIKTIDNVRRIKCGKEERRGDRSVANNGKNLIIIHTKN